jgi:hypothetical protein
MSDSSDKQDGNRKGSGSASTRFRPGQSGNPKGRPKGKTLTEVIRKKLAQKGEDGQSLLNAIAQVFVDEAKAGHYQFAKELIDRVDGKVPDRVAGPGGDDLTIRVVYVNRRRDPAPGTPPVPANGHGRFPAI